MIPKKEILFINADEDRLSLDRLRFSLLGYRVFSAETERSAVKQIELHPGIQVAVIAMNGVRWAPLIAEMKALIPDIRTMLTCTYLRSSELAHQADCFLGQENCDLVTVRDHVRMLATRKRGPKKPVERVTAANMPGEIASGA